VKNRQRHLINYLLSGLFIVVLEIQSFGAILFFDDFTGSQLSSDWTILNEDPAHYSLNGGILDIQATAGDVFGNQNNHENMFLISTPTTGDFRVTIRVESFVPVSQNFTQFDIVAFDDQDNLVRSIYGYVFGGRNLEFGAEISASWTNEVANLDLGASPFFFRLVKVGITYTQSYSLDGISFFQVLSSVNFGDGTPNFIGIWAGVDPTESSHAFVDYIMVEDAVTVKILSSTLVGTIADADGDDDLNAFYQNEGFSSSKITGSISGTDLSNVDLFVSMLPDDSFSVSEISALSTYLSTGGRILFMGDQNGFSSTENGYINTALSDLGSSMSLGASSIDTGFNNTSSGQILTNLFTSGLNLVNYGNVNSITGIPPGNELFLAKDLSTAWGGYESVGGGTIVLLADTNMISHIEDTGGNDNHVFFMNVASAAREAKFSSDFESGVPVEFSGITTRESVQGYAAHGFSGHFLRNLTSSPPQKTTLTLSNLPTHDFISIRFLLAIIDTWDGTVPGPGPDFFNVTLDGISIFSESFQNAFGGDENYAAPPGVLLVEKTQLGFRDASPNDRESGFSMGNDPAFQKIPHSAPTAVIEWFASGAGWDHAGDGGAADESWAIDDVFVSVSSMGDPPSISLTRIDVDTFELNYSGVLQGSTDLIQWDDVSPQPLCPWRFSPSEDKMFFRAREY